MAIFLMPFNLPFLSSVVQKSSSYILLAPQNCLNYSSLSPNSKSHLKPTNSCDSFRISYRFSDGISTTDADDDGDTEGCSFDKAVTLFNNMDYYRCHDFLESLWNKSEEPIRTIIHGILQCAVGFHHLFNHNHKGAMMELGEGLCKLRKMNFNSGPFHQFEREISAVLNFIYQTQTELAACTEDLCLTMDRTERSYQCLGDYAAGCNLYRLQSGPNDITYIVFSPERSYGTSEQPRVKLPTLHATEGHLLACDYN